MAAIEPMKPVNLAGIRDVAAFVGNKFPVKGKVLSKEEPETVPSKERKLQTQFCVISDSSGSCKLVLWEKLVNKVDCNKC